MIAFELSYVKRLF